MGRLCVVCHHPQRREIDRNLLEGSARYRRLVEQHDVSLAGLARHASAHLPARMVKAKDARDVANGDDLLERLQSLTDDTLEILAAAKAAGPSGWGAALGAIKRAEAQIELFAKLVGQLQPDQMNVSLVFAPAWRELERVITDALAPYPEARQAVATAIASAGHHAGE